MDILVTRITVFELDGEVHYSAYGGAPGWEARLPVLFSGAVLLSASLAMFHLGRADTAPRVWRWIAALFGFMAVDELIGLHEVLEAWVGVDWQLMYTPIAVAAALLWMRVLVLIRGEKAVALWVGGAACWLLSQLLEALRWETGFGEAAWQSLTVAEEALEMSGSALLLITALVLYSPRGGPSGPIQIPAERV